MTLILELTPEQEAGLGAEAERRGQSMGAFALEVLMAGLPELPDPSLPKTPQEIAEYWEREKLFVLEGRTDIPDSPEYARQLRRQAEKRARG